MKLLTPDNFSQHIPHVNLAKGDGAVVDITAGVLYADRALKIVQVDTVDGASGMSFFFRNWCHESKPIFC